MAQAFSEWLDLFKITLAAAASGSVLGDAPPSFTDIVLSAALLADEAHDLVQVRRSMHAATASSREKEANVEKRSQQKCCNCGLDSEHPPRVVIRSSGNTQVLRWTGNDLDISLCGGTISIFAPTCFKCMSERATQGQELCIFEVEFDLPSTNDEEEPPSGDSLSFND